VNRLPYTWFREDSGESTHFTFHFAKFGDEPPISSFSIEAEQLASSSTHFEADVQRTISGPGHAQK
jgi:hypothetical protein